MTQEIIHVVYTIHYVNTAVKRLRMRELLSELRFQLVQRLRKSIPLDAFMKL